MSYCFLVEVPADKDEGLVFIESIEANERKDVGEEDV